MKYSAIILALLLGLTCHAATIDGRVVSVADGDTITVLDADKVQHKIRLAVISSTIEKACIRPALKTKPKRPSV